MEDWVEQACFHWRVTAFQSSSPWVAMWRISMRLWIGRRVTLSLRGWRIAIRLAICLLRCVASMWRNWLVNTWHLLHRRNCHSRLWPKLAISLVHFNLVLGLHKPGICRKSCNCKTILLTHQGIRWVRLIIYQSIKSHWLQKLGIKILWCVTFSILFLKEE